MLLPDLPPDLRFEPIPLDEAGLDFTVAVKKAAFRPHVEAKWVWNDEQQRAIMRERFGVRPYLQIRRGENAIGIIALTKSTRCVTLDDFYLLPEHHKHGIGTRILQHCIAVCDEMGLPIELRYLKWNPVGSLYSRHGFVVTGDTEFHWLAERPTKIQGIKL